MRPRKLVPVAAGLTLLLAAAACTSSGSTTDNSAPAPKASGAALSLKGVCPDTVVIQTDWFPESEYGHLYQLLGPGYTIDKKKKILSAARSSPPARTPASRSRSAPAARRSASRRSARRCTRTSRSPSARSTPTRRSQNSKSPADPRGHRAAGDQPADDPLGHEGAPGLQHDRRHRPDRHQDPLLPDRRVRAVPASVPAWCGPARWTARTTARRPGSSPRTGTIANAGFATSEPYIFKNELPKGHRATTRTCS